MIPSEYCFFCKSYLILYFEGKERASSFIQLSQQIIVKARRVQTSKSLSLSRMLSLQR